jgi:hypothetical protein
MIERARSYVNAAAWPAPAFAKVTAGEGVGEDALEYKVARLVVPLIVYRSAGP